MNLARLRMVVALVALLLGGVVLGLVLSDGLRAPPPSPPPQASRVLGQWQPAAARGEPLLLDFLDAAGGPASLEAFRGRVVLVNLWATWCAPCIEEMPALDRLAARLGGPDFEVVAIALDRQGEKVVRPFFEKLALSRLGFHLDPSNATSRTLAAPGLPLSVLLDRDGREMGRVLGAAAWDAPQFEAIIRGAMRP